MALSGSGTSGDPYIVATAADLTEVVTYNGAGVYFKQTANIALTAYQAGAGWTPICTSAAPFAGIYDGDNKTVSALRINSTTNLGLFAAITGTVQKLTLDDFSITGSTDYVGALAGFINGATLSNIAVKSISITARDYIGGLVGSILGSSTVITSCSVGTLSSSAGTITARNSCGGFFGYGAAGVTITKCFANAVVAATVGGGGTNAGGFCGYNTCTITKCFAKGNVTGYGYVGGFSGYNYSVGTTTDCGSWGNATRSGTGINDYIGGFIGWNRVACTRCYSTGTVTIPGESDATYAGGFAGNSTGGSNTNNYWDTESSGMATSNGGTGLTTAQAKSAANYSGWDFSAVWWLTEGSTYPQLRDIVPPPTTFSPFFLGGGI